MQYDTKECTGGMSLTGGVTERAIGTGRRVGRALQAVVARPALKSDGVSLKLTRRAIEARVAVS